MKKGTNPAHASKDFNLNIIKGLEGFNYIKLNYC